MEYISTRGDVTPHSFTEIFFSAHAPDGGLWIPKRFPKVSSAQLLSWQGLDYASLAFEIFHLFAPELPRRELWRLCQKVYSDEIFTSQRNIFRSQQITPLHYLHDRVCLLELTNGPSLSFDDISMQFLAAFTRRFIPEEKRPDVLLGATSGDMGTAAEIAFAEFEGMDLVLVSPHQRMSFVQAAMLYGPKYSNVEHVVVEGSFDHCQKMVTDILKDQDFVRKHKLGALNNTLWSRIVAQVVYYFYGYFRAIEKMGEEVVYCVPAGNFGNAFAGWVAKRMGLPILMLRVATNENDCFDRFVRTGRYQPRSATETLKTSSPSTDISRAANLERFLYEVLGCDGQRVLRLMTRLDTEGGFRLTRRELATMNESIISSGSSNHSNRLEIIEATHLMDNVYIDPHTADAMFVGTYLRPVGVKTIVLETVHPVKFPALIKQVTGHEPPLPRGFVLPHFNPEFITPMDIQEDGLRQILSRYGAD